MVHNESKSRSEDDENDRTGWVLNQKVNGPKSTHKALYGKFYTYISRFNSWRCFCVRFNFGSIQTYREKEEQMNRPGLFFKIQSMSLDT